METFGKCGKGGGGKGSCWLFSGFHFFSCMTHCGHADLTNGGFCQIFKIKSQDGEHCSNIVCSKSPFISTQKAERRRNSYSKKRADPFPPLLLLCSFGSTNMSTNVRTTLSAEKLSL